MLIQYHSGLHITSEEIVSRLSTETTKSENQEERTKQGSRNEPQKSETTFGVYFILIHPLTLLNLFLLSLYYVELAGVEPASKQGNHVLSTRLFRTSFSRYGKTQTTNRILIL